MSFVLKRLPHLFKDSIINVTHKLVPATISPLKSRRGATLLCKDVKVSLLSDTILMKVRSTNTALIHRFEIPSSFICALEERSVL